MAGLGFFGSNETPFDTEVDSPISFVYGVHIRTLENIAHTPSEKFMIEVAISFCMRCYRKTLATPNTKFHDLLT
jgi:hypothetical protein